VKTCATVTGSTKSSRVGDKKQSISAINLGVQEYLLDTSISAFWSDSANYAEYLLTSFEKEWSEAVPAEERIQELLGQFNSHI
jgi:hypothetical protein